MELPNPYLWKNYKFLAVIPAVLILLSAFMLYSNASSGHTTIFGLTPGIDFKGGLLLTVYSDGQPDAVAVKAALSGYGGADVRPFESPTGNGIEIELPPDEGLAQAEEKLVVLHDLDANLTRAEISDSFYSDNVKTNASALNDAQATRAKVEELSSRVLETAAEIATLAGSNETVGTSPHAAVGVAERAIDASRSNYREGLISVVSAAMPVKTYSFKEIGSSLSKFFVTKGMEVVLYSFLLSAIVIFAVFRSFVPSVAVLFGAGADIFITLGGMALFGVPLTLASFAALLMLIGFSLDTDVLLTMRVLKRKEDTPPERAFGAMKTGLLMNACAMTSYGVLALFAVMLQIPTYYQIGIVVVLGAFADFFATWCANAVMVLWYAEKRDKKHGVV
ncbi:hypothetical protein COU36_02440 [Candidatus Micrarchaeota archaeon CG10_big_fil_rev_8_21_14_0_10_59_7]|nr:MAG: hypothetical protein COU36_02440 [Candidatus Micrarchaeota archaeon CG10_big_fil_rev_8_21_14_0_10_59_7]